jgi:hypothetical protein
MCRNIAPRSRARYPDAETVQVDAVNKLLVDGHTKLALMLANALAQRGRRYVRGERRTAITAEVCLRP